MNFSSSGKKKSELRTSQKEMKKIDRSMSLSTLSTLRRMSMWISLLCGRERERERCLGIYRCPWFIIRVWHIFLYRVQITFFWIYHYLSI